MRHHQRIDQKLNFICQISQRQTRNYISVIQEAMEQKQVKAGMKNSKQTVITTSSSTMNSLRSPKASSSVKRVTKTSTQKHHQQMMDLQASPASRCADTTPQSKQTELEHQQHFVHQSEFVACQPTNDVIDSVKEVKIGAWSKEAKVEDIEAYLISSQRKMVKYRLNIFYLNRCALKIQHAFFRARAKRQQQSQHSLAEEAQRQQQMLIQTKSSQQDQKQVLVSSQLYQQTQYQSPIQSVINVSTLSGSEMQCNAAYQSINSAVVQNNEQDEMSVKTSEEQQVYHEKTDQLHEQIQLINTTSKSAQSQSLGESQQLVGQIRYRADGIEQSLHKATPSFKTTDDGEFVGEFDQAKVVQAVENTMSQNYISQKRTRKASPMSGQSQEQHQRQTSSKHHVIDELEEIKEDQSLQIGLNDQVAQSPQINQQSQQQQKSSLMNATTSSKGRERGLLTRGFPSSNEKSRKKQSSQTMMAKTTTRGGGKTTMTTLVTTTTFIDSSGKVLSKSSKQTEKFASSSNLKSASAKKSSAGSKIRTEIIQGSPESQNQIERTLKQDSTKNLSLADKQTLTLNKNQSMALKFEKKQIAPIQPAQKNYEVDQSEQQSVHSANSSENFQTYSMSEIDHQQKTNADELSQVQQTVEMNQQEYQELQPVPPTNLQDQSLQILQKKSLERTAIMATLRQQSPKQAVAEHRQDDADAQNKRVEMLEQSESKVVNDEATEINTTVYKSPEFSFQQKRVVNQVASNNSIAEYQDNQSNTLVTDVEVTHDDTMHQSQVSCDTFPLGSQINQSQQSLKASTKMAETGTNEVTRQDCVSNSVSEQQIRAPKNYKQKQEHQHIYLNKVKQLDVSFNTQGHQYQNTGIVTDRERSHERIEKINMSYNDKNHQSYSQLSSRSTFSMEQKRVQPSRQLNSTMIAAKSLSRFQERYTRQSKIQAYALMNKTEPQQSSPKKNDWKALDLVASQKLKVSDEDARLLRARQLASMNRLTQQTASSRGKSRIASKSAERLNIEQHTELRETKTNYSTQKQTQIHRNSRSRTTLQPSQDIANLVSPLALDTTQGSQVTSKTFKSRRETQQTPQMTSRTAKSKGASKITSTFTTSTRYFVDGKEQRSTVSKQRESSQSKSSAMTPRIRATNQQQQQQFRKVRDMSPQNTKSNTSFQRGRSNTALNKQNRAYQSTISASNKSIKRDDMDKKSTQKLTSTTQSDVQKLPQAYASENQQYETVKIEEVKEMRQSRSPMTRKKQSSSFNATSSAQMRLTNQRGKVSTKQAAEAHDRDNAFTQSQRTVTQTYGRGIPSAAQARAAQRRQREEDRMQLDTLGVQSEPQPMEMSGASSKGRDSMHSFATSSSKGITLTKQKSSLTSKAAYSQQNQQQLLSEQHEKRRDQINDEAVYQEQQRFMSEQQRQEGLLSETNNSESMQNFEREATKALNEAEVLNQVKTLQSNEYEKVVNNMQIKKQVSSTRNSAKSTVGSKTGRSPATSAQTMFIKEETKTHINKAFNEDIFFSKIERSFRRDFSSIKEVLQVSYSSLVAIFIYYAGQSHSYPAMAQEDFMAFCHETALVGGQQGLLSEVAIMKCFTLTISQTNNFKKAGEKVLNRYEFLEILVQIAALINKEADNKPQNEGISSTLLVLLTNWILPNAQKTSRTKFWQVISADSHVIELLSKNNDVLYAAFKYFTQEQAPRVTLEICVAISRLCQLDVADKLIGIIFAESQQLVIDTMRNKERIVQLTFPEFVYFVCRATDAHYDDTVYENEEYWIKLDHMIQFLLDPFDLRPQFRYGAKFVADTHHGNTDYLEAGDEYHTQNVAQEDAPIMVHNIGMQRAESTRYMQVSEDMQEVDEDEEVSSVQVDGMHDGDIQAWPQPSPIAYPQRKDMIVASPAITTSNSVDISSVVIADNSNTNQVMQHNNNSSLIGVSEHEISVVQHRQRLANTSSVVKTKTTTSYTGGQTKTRTYVKSFQQRQQ